MKTSFVKLFLLFALAGVSPAWGIDGLYVGGQAGFTGLTGNPTTTYANALGFGFDLGVKSSYAVDVLAHFFTSSHSGAAGLTLYSGTVSADVHVLRADAFDVSVGAGPGFYSFSGPATNETDFGLNFGGAMDVLVDEALVIGVGAKYHAVFNGPVGGSFYAITMRVGYIFGF